MQLTLLILKIKKCNITVTRQTRKICKCVDDGNNSNGNNNNNNGNEGTL